MTRDERVMLAAYRCLYPQAREIGGATVLRSDEAPGSPMLNRIVGLGRNGPATEAGLDEALAAIGDDVTCYVAVAPGAQPGGSGGLVARTGARAWVGLDGLPP